MQKKQNLIKKIYEKLCIRQWTIGFSRGSIVDIIRSKSFNPDIQWLPFEPFHRFFADPFFYEKKDKELNILVEEFSIKDDYGKISLLAFDESFHKTGEKVLLDTQSHLSYPYLFKENNKTYVFPEAGKSGKLSCYEYDRESQRLTFLQTIIELPIMDPTVLKLKNKYWIFGTIYGERARRNLYIFFSDNILGPYKQHPGNPVTNSLNGSRPAGNFITIDGTLFRPAQNCENYYGGSITINKVNVIDEMSYKEEPYMSLTINRKNKLNKNILTIHTINVLGDIIVVDGEKRAFYPFRKLKYRLMSYIQARLKIKT
jgi:hypothetical protein